jgi:endonuclease-3
VAKSKTGSRKLEELNELATIVYRKLRKRFPEAVCALDFKNPLELLFATILSAQCTDVRVNIVTKDLFSRCKKLEDYLGLKQKELEEIIRSTGFFRNKAENILKAALEIKERFSGKVPKSMEELVSLPGVGRKTANVVLGNGFDLPGLPVDTHVIRVSNRIGLTKQHDPVKIETELCALIPPKEWARFSLTLIFHGRQICKARKPECDKCPVAENCQYFLELEKGLTHAA